MSEITDKQINDSIKNCKWRQSFNGIDICSGEVGPCSRIIENGRCDTLRRLFSNNKKDEVDNNE